MWLKNGFEFIERFQKHNFEVYHMTRWLCTTLRMNRLRVRTLVWRLWVLWVCAATSCRKTACSVQNTRSTKQGPNCLSSQFASLAIFHGAQLVDYPIEKPGAILTRVWVSGAAKDFFLPESTSSADSLTVSVQPPCAIECINICVHVKNPKHLAAITLFGHTKILHTLTEMGSG